MIIFSVLLCPVHIWLQIYDEVESTLFGIQAGYMEAGFFAVQSILLYLCIGLLDIFLKKNINHLSMVTVKNYQLLFHTFILILGIFVIFLSSLQKNENNNQITIQGADFIFLCLYVLWAPLAGVRFSGMLVKSAIDLSLLVLLLFKVTDQDSDNDGVLDEVLIMLMMFFVYVFGCLASHQLELISRERFIQAAILGQAQIRADMRLNPFSVSNLKTWVERRIAREQSTYSSSFPSSDNVSSPLLAEGSASHQVSLPIIDPSFQTQKAGLWDIDFRDLKMGPRVASGGGGLIRKGEYGKTPVAIKQLFGTVRSASDLSEFANEVQTLFSLGNFPTIVRMYGISQNRGSFFLVMEWCDSNLANVLEGGPSVWPSGEAIAERGDAYIFLLRCAQQVCCAMTFLHDHGFVHLDLKPANILVQSNFSGYKNSGDGLAIKLCDFGLAKHANNPNGGTRGGTPLFMAPEISALDAKSSLHTVDYNNVVGKAVTGTRSVRSQFPNLTIEQMQKADVYAFAFVLYAMLNGNRIFEAELKTYGNSSLMAEIRKGFRPQIRSDCPPEIEQILMACWSEKCYNRPSFRQISQTIDTLIEQVRPFGDNGGARVPWSDAPNSPTSLSDPLRMR
jgi:serine/threonine protein kinase